MKTGSASWCVGVLLLVGTLTAAEAAGPLTQVGSWMSLGSPAHDLVIEGDLAYVVTDLGLTIVNISNPAAPLIRGSVKLGGKGYGVAVKGDYAAVNISTDLKVIDVPNSRPRGGREQDHPLRLGRGVRMTSPTWGMSGRCTSSTSRTPSIHSNSRPSG